MPNHLAVGRWTENFKKGCEVILIPKIEKKCKNREKMKKSRKNETIEKKSKNFEKI
jgi:hypothetical protein